MKKEKSIGYKIHTKNAIKYAEDKLNLLGVDNTLTPIKVLNLRFLVCVLVFILTLLVFRLGFILAPIFTFLAFQLFFPLYIDRKINERTKELEKDAGYFFEILVLSLEAGRNIKSAIEVTCKNIDSALSREFQKAVKDVNYGKDLNEALIELSARIPSDAINNIVLNIRQSNTFGNNIISTIYSQIDYIREKRMLDIKGEISKIPVKISVISVIFFIPLLLLLLLGPMLIDLI